MTRLLGVLLLTAALLMGACAASKTQTRSWQPGDTIICPHCGRQFPVPEKLDR